MKAPTRPNANLFYLLLVLITSALAPRADAFSYNDGELILVFRKDGFNDVEFNLGSVSNFLGKATGTSQTVTGWDPAVVRTNFNNSLASVKFLLLAATSATDGSRRVWSTSANLYPSTPVTDLSGSRWGAWRSKINFVGSEATAITGTNATQTFIVAASDASAYTFIVSDGGQLDAATVGGLAPFPVEVENPSSLLFYEIKISNLAVKPAAPVIGWFCLEASGTLTFIAGPMPPLPRPRIVSLARTGNNNVLSFTTTNCANYRLRYAADPTGTWTTGTTLAPGNGSVVTLSDNVSGAQRFYQVEALR